MKTNFVTERYCEMMLPQSHRSALSKFRCGVAPIRKETGYEGLAESLRICPFCNLVENEIHVLIHCHLYEDLRETLFSSPVQSTGRAIVVTLASALALPFPSRLVEREVLLFYNNCALPDTSMTLSAFVL